MDPKTGETTEQRPQQWRDHAVTAQLLAVQSESGDNARAELYLQVGPVRLRGIAVDADNADDLPAPGSRIRVILRPELSFLTRPKKAGKKFAAHGPTLHALSVQGVVVENDGSENVVIDAGVPVVAHVTDKDLLGRAAPGSWVEFESDPPTRVLLLR